jgi:hypothetical protein
MLIRYGSTKSCPKLSGFVQSMRHGLVITVKSSKEDLTVFIVRGNPAALWTMGMRLTS